jgi:hypothetical protein
MQGFAENLFSLSEKGLQASFSKALHTLHTLHCSSLPVSKILALAQMEKRPYTSADGRGGRSEPKLEPDRILKVKVDGQKSCWRSAVRPEPRLVLKARADYQSHWPSKLVRDVQSWPRNGSGCQCQLSGPVAFRLALRPAPEPPAFNPSLLRPSEGVLLSGFHAGKRPPSGVPLLSIIIYSCSIE